MKPIGIIHTPFTELQNMPIQPVGASEVQGQVVIDPEFAAGLADLAGFSHLFLLYLFHQATRTELTVTPFMDTVPRGVFATRSPLRPNHLGLSVVRLLSVTGTTVHIQGADILDGTPLIDIKPYISAFDQVKNSRDGWMEGTRADVAAKRSDDRFA
ncbi:MAG: tRNA (N6-threonylcarbamoyladenosine(37)-N6)-methyltransferase TrmO [Desulfopila sp.]